MSVETGERQRSGADWDKVRLKRCRSALIWTFWTSFDPCLVFSSLSFSLQYYCHCGAFGVKLLSVQDLDSNSSKRTALPAFLFIAALSESQVLLFSNPRILDFVSDLVIIFRLHYQFLFFLFIFLKIKCALFSKCSENLKVLWTAAVVVAEVIAFEESLDSL